MEKWGKLQSFQDFSFVELILRTSKTKEAHPPITGDVWVTNRNKKEVAFFFPGYNSTGKDLSKKENNSTGKGCQGPSESCRVVRFKPLLEREVEWRHKKK